MTTERRQGSRLDFESERGLLVVGGRTAVVDPEPPPEVIVGTYVSLVLAQRAIAPATRYDLRDRELLQLADLVQLPPAELDALIDRELDRMLGRATPRAGSGGRRWTLTFGALAVVAAAAIAVTAATGGAAPDNGDQPSPAPTSETILLPDGSTATRTESAPAPAGDGVDIGTAVVYER